MWRLQEAQQQAKAVLEEHLQLGGALSAAAGSDSASEEEAAPAVVA